MGVCGAGVLACQVRSARTLTLRKLMAVDLYFSQYSNIPVFQHSMVNQVGLC